MLRVGLATLIHRWEMRKLMAHCTLTLQWKCQWKVMLCRKTWAIHRCINRLNLGEKALVCLLLNVLEIPCDKTMLVCLTTGDIILNESVLVPRFSRDRQYPETCYRCCQPFNYGCLITGGGLVSGLQTQACTCTKTWVSEQCTPRQLQFPIRLSLHDEYLSVTSR